MPSFLQNKSGENRASTAKTDKSEVKPAPPKPDTRFSMGESKKEEPKRESLEATHQKEKDMMVTLKLKLIERQKQVIADKMKEIERESQRESLVND